MDELVKYISLEMNRNVHSARAHPLKSLVAQPATYALALWHWKNLVGYNKKWDHKKKIRLSVGQWSYDPITKYEFFFDIWSNVHYGYIGLSVGFGEAILKSGAGLAQLKESGFTEGFVGRCTASSLELACFPALDYPEDQAAIQVGFDLWKSKGFACTEKDVADLIRARRAVLSAKRRMQ